VKKWQLFPSYVCITSTSFSTVQFDVRRRDKIREQEVIILGILLPVEFMAQDVQKSGHKVKLRM
jgi:hypothetical protein